MDSWEILIGYLTSKFNRNTSILNKLYVCWILLFTIILGLSPMVTSLAFNAPRHKDSNETQNVTGKSHISYQTWHLTRLVIRLNACMGNKKIVKARLSNKSLASSWHSCFRQKTRLFVQFYARSSMHAWFCIKSEFISDFFEMIWS